MSNNNSKPPLPVASISTPSAASAPTEDPLIITTITLCETVTIGSHGAKEWSIRPSINSQHYGKLLIEECDEGIRIIFANKQAKLYEEHTVYAANIADVCRVPLSSLDKSQREMWEKCQREVRR